MNVLMLKTNRQGGFTLIEIMLAMAVSAGLLSIVFVGQRQIREQAQFSDSVERQVATLVSVKNEANNTLNALGAGNIPTEEIYGLAATYMPGSSIVTVDTLVASVDKDTGNYTSNTLARRDSYTVSMPYGSRYDASSPSKVVVFAKAHISGQLLGYSMTPANYTDLTAYPGSAQPGFNIHLVNYNASHSADVTVDPATLSITRVFN
jgi:prepilin-type N-terminal cleavage/methylation domain-containing protein